MKKSPDELLAEQVQHDDTVAYIDQQRRASQPKIDRRKHAQHSIRPRYKKDPNIKRVMMLEKSVIKKLQ